MSFRALLVVGALGLAGCGGGVTDGGSYCVVVDPPNHDYECQTGDVAVTVTNSCLDTLILSDPIVDAECSDLLQVSSVDGIYELAPGETANFELQYIEANLELWDCRVSFPHDLIEEPIPELPVAGGGELCE